MSHNGSSETSSFLDENWTTWFCGLSGNHFFCEVEKSYIEDSFNLFGLKQFLAKDYGKALDTILDRLTPMEPESEELSRSAALLYGLIHARYIITSHGLDAMHRKFLNREFGECPRMLCRGQPIVPMGFTDEPKHGMVKLFCPKCRDVYNCSASQRHIDGAFFGPTFPHIFFMSFEDSVPESATEQYVPRVFGFRVHPSSNSIPKNPGVLAGRGQDSRGNLPHIRTGHGGLSEASTGAGTGYEKSGGAESSGLMGLNTRGLLPRGPLLERGRMSATSGGATGEEEAGPVPVLVGGGWEKLPPSSNGSVKVDRDGDRDSSSSNLDGLGLAPGSSLSRIDVAGDNKESSLAAGDASLAAGGASVGMSFAHSGIPGMTGAPNESLTVPLTETALRSANAAAAATGSGGSLGLGGKKRGRPSDMDETVVTEQRARRAQKY